MNQQSTIVTINGRQHYRDAGGRAYPTTTPKGNFTRGYIARIKQGKLPTPSGFKVINNQLRKDIDKSDNLPSRLKKSDAVALGFKTLKELTAYIKDKKSKNVLLKTKTQVLAERQKDLINSKLSFIQKNLKKAQKYKKFTGIYKHTTKKASAFRRYNVVYNIDDGETYRSVESFWKAYAPRFRYTMIDFGFPMDINVYVKVRMTDNDGNCKLSVISLGKYKVFTKEDASDVLKKMYDRLEYDVQFDDGYYLTGFLRPVFSEDDNIGGSGWVVDSIVSADVYCNRIKDLNGSQYFEMPDWLNSKKCIVNPDNQDNKCLLHCINFFENLDHINSKKVNFKVDRFKKFWGKYEALFKDFEFPMSRSQFPKVERIFNINLVVYDLDLTTNPNSKRIVPLYAKRDPDALRKTLKLILVRKVIDGEERRHYVWVKRPSALFFNTVNKHKCKTIMCDRCFGCYPPHRFDDHICCDGATKIELPKNPRECKFKSVYRSMRHTFAVYADTEALILLNNFKTSQKRRTTPEASGATETLNQHIPCSFAYIIVKEGNIYKTRFYRGENPMRVFMDYIQQDYTEIFDEYYSNTNEPMTAVDYDDYNATTHCKLCGDEFADESPYKPSKKITDQIKSEIGTMLKQCGKTWKNIPKAIRDKYQDYLWKPVPKDISKKRKCRDHDHITGLYRQALCQECNLNYKIRTYLPVFFHNLRGYDGHFVMKSLSSNDMTFQGIPQNREKMTSFSLKDGKREICFRDSFSFLPTSIDEIAKGLVDDDFKLLKSYLSGLTSDEDKAKDMFRLLRQKGVYPYEYMDSFNRFNETELPPIEMFFSKSRYQKDSVEQLTESEWEQLRKEYQHARRVWDFFECKTLGDYHDLYLKTDILILGDAFENLRETSLRDHGLDPVHYITGPQLFFDAMLKKFGRGLELLTEKDREIYELFEKGIVGGISMIRHRYSKANNRYMDVKLYDPEKKDIYILYIDANSLYPTVMRWKLPAGDFKILQNISTMANEDIYKLVCGDVDGDFGYLCEVDTLTPDHLHDYFNDLPPFPEPCDITDDDLSDLQKIMLKALGKDTHKSRKLAPNLKPKTKHIIHSKLLKLFVDLGCVVTKFHTVVRFRQEVLFKDYIDSCVQRRQESSTDFQKDFHKNCMNTPFGKTCENKRKRTDIKIANKSKDNEKYANDPRTIWWKPINEDCVAYHMIKKKTVLDRPIYLGWAILQLSKYHMYNTYYNVFKPKWGDKMKLCLMDTDSFILQVETKDVYDDLMELDQKHNMMDWSNYSNDHPVFRHIPEDQREAFKNKNKKIPGFFKDETKGKPILEFAGLRSKMYSYMTEDGWVCKGKGIKKGVLKNMVHQEYVEVVRFMDAINGDLGSLTKDNIIKGADMYSFQSSIHTIFTNKLYKTTLCSFDDKTIFEPDGIHTIAIGHVRYKKVVKSK